MCQNDFFSNTTKRAAHYTSFHFWGRPKLKSGGAHWLGRIKLRRLKCVPIEKPSRVLTLPPLSLHVLCLGLRLAKPSQSYVTGNSKGGWIDAKCNTESYLKCWITVQRVTNTDCREGFIDLFAETPESHSGWHISSFSLSHLHRRASAYEHWKNTR